MVNGIVFVTVSEIILYLKYVRYQLRDTYHMGEHVTDCFQ